ncbi:MAG: hypothetical protein OEV66_08030, partial [Spirochaetia bacterium]|nr:hypothetical protein [Spirochaetia bacterium]
MYTWTVSARLNGAYFAGNIVSPAANASIKVDEIFSDFFKIYMEGAYFLNNPIYDGNGNHSFINQINANAKFTYMPDNKWDINIFPDFTFAQNFMHPAITMEAKYYAENFLVGAFAAYGYQSYIFPVQNSSIVINNPLGGIYFTWYLGKSLDLNFTGKYNMNIFNTSGAFTEGLTGIGLSWYPDKKFSLGGDILSGIDSAGYFMAGINMNIFYKFLRDFSLYADCSYKYYTSQAMMGSTAT